MILHRQGRCYNICEEIAKVLVTVMIIIVKNRVTPDGKRIILESPHKKSHYAEEKERRSPSSAILS